MGILSPAQVAGYFALALGITAFLQRDDRRLKFFSATQGLVYALHFILLGNLPACGSAVVSSVRTYLALRYRNFALALFFIAVHVITGAALARNAAGWLPVAACSIATYAMFYMTGIPLRCVLLASTVMWLANNIISGSIGGTVLEIANAALNISTMWRMLRADTAEADMDGRARAA